MAGIVTPCNTGMSLNQNAMLPMDDVNAKLWHNEIWSGEVAR